MYDLELTRSLSYLTVCDELMREYVNCGIKKVEFILSNPPIDFDPDTFTSKLQESVDILHKHGIELLSIHLPQGPNWELCTCDDFIRERAVEQYLKMIECCNTVKPKRYVLHPGYPNVPAEEREQRIENFRKNVVLLSNAALPAKIAVENMPQDCLGNTSDELIRLVDGIDNICVCCDMNHYFHEKPYEAILNLGSRIETLHVSDYDGVNEKHWLPGKGVNDWVKIIEALQSINYQGPFMYECSHIYSCAEVAESKKIMFEKFAEKCK